MAFYLKIFILIVLLYFSSIFSSSETALTAINATKIRNIREKDKRKGEILRNLKLQTNSVLAVILIGNNIVNVAATAILTELTLQFFKKDGSIVISTIIMTVLILVFGEITPKTFAAQNPEKIAVRVAGLLSVLLKIFKPILYLLTKITNFIIRVLGGEISENTTFITEEEIKSIVDVGEEEGILEHHERMMIEGIFEIDDTDVTNVMVPRIDITAVSKNSNLRVALSKIIKNGHSRIPIYDNSIDNIIGLLYAKDILPFAINNSLDINKTNVEELMRDTYYVPQTKKVGELLKDMQREKVHMAIVLDEYGATEGLVTIEDILEEIVGDIFDEYDDEEKVIEKISENKYNVKADIALEEFNDVFNCDLPEEEFESLGGYIFSTLGRVAIVGDKIKYKQLTMCVIKVSKRRILSVEVEINNS
ncbi:hemolysin family protein [Abyssisolibacter fermentans]|uniref:hemolysin family protein n=1 Tax=Abyssisolibacter fermentans TaxID=1766203 RepID=UPI00082B1233|nr:hemolysin family protein [Abyssisolibacter fermentans]